MNDRFHIIFASFVNYFGRFIDMSHFNYYNESKTENSF